MLKIDLKKVPSPKFIFARLCRYNGPTFYEKKIPLEKGDVIVEKSQVPLSNFKFGPYCFVNKDIFFFFFSLIEVH